MVRALALRQSFCPENSELPLKNHKIKVALNPQHRIFKTLQRVSSYPSDYFSEIKIGDYRVRF